MSVVLKLLTLMKLSANQPIADPITGFPTASFQRLINSQAANETTITNAIAAQVNDITSALDQAGIATTTATDAQTTADAAQTAANTANGNASTALATAGSVAHLLALTASFPSPGILTATDAGVINIAAHNRYYANGTMVAVNAGSVDGLALSTTYYVSYIDTARAGGAVSYAATTDMTASAQIGDRHVIGVVTTPASGAAQTSGNTTLAPGIPSQT